MTPIRLVVLGATHWLHTQAVYHALAETMTADSPDTIVLTIPAQPYLCIGYHQSLDSVLDRAVCARRGLPIVRRRVGGGATYLDANQIFYQCIFHHSHLPALVNRQYALLLAAPVATLRALGADAQLCGDNEIEVRGRRIAGIGGGRIEEAAVVVGNLLFDFDYETMASVWRVPSDPFRALALEAMHAAVTTLRRERPQPVAMADVETLLAGQFERALGRPVERGELSEKEWAAIEATGLELVSEEWLNLHAGSGEPMRMLKISRSTYIHEVTASLDDYQLMASLLVRDGLIANAHLRSDPPTGWADWQERLKGVGLAEWAGIFHSAIPAGS